MSVAHFVRRLYTGAGVCLAMPFNELPIDDYVDGSCSIVVVTSIDDDNCNEINLQCVCFCCFLESFLMDYRLPIRIVSNGWFVGRFAISALFRKVICPFFEREQNVRRQRNGSGNGSWISLLIRISFGVSAATAMTMASATSSAVGEVHQAKSTPKKSCENWLRDCFTCANLIVRLKWWFT